MKAGEVKGFDRRLAAGAVAVVLLGGSSVLSGCAGHPEPAPDPLKHPCLLLSASQAADVLQRPPGAAREITQDEVSECAYRDGELYVSVAHASYDSRSFRDLIDHTRGQAVTESGLGDAAYSFHTQEDPTQEDPKNSVLLDILKGNRLIQITAPTAEDARKAASVVLPHLR